MEINFKNVKMVDMKKVLKELTKDSYYTWKIERRLDGLFITNSYFTNNNDIEEGFRIRQSDDEIIKANLEYRKYDEITYRSKANVYLVENSDYADFSEFNIESFKRIAKDCIHYMNTYV